MTPTFFCASYHRFRDIHICNVESRPEGDAIWRRQKAFSTFFKSSQVAIFITASFDGIYHTLQMFLTHFSIAFTVSEIPKFLIYDFQKVGQGHGVQYSLLHHSMANVIIYKCLPHILCLTVTISEIYKFEIISLF